MRRSPSLILSFCILLAGSFAAQAAGTASDRRACRSDAMRLCREFIPNTQRITACMRRNMAQLSPACQAQFPENQKRRR